MSAAKVLPLEQAPARVLDQQHYEQYLPLVRRIALRFAQRLPSHVAVADLVGYGWLGLMDAYARAAPEMDNEEFEAYAMYRIRGAILDHLRTLDPVSRRARALARKLKHTTVALAKEKGQEPEAADVATRLGLSLREYQILAADVAQTTAARLSRVDIADVEPAATTQAPDEGASERELRERVQSAIAGLPRRLRAVLELYYGDDLTLRQIGESQGVTESRVCQLHAEAIQLLRLRLGVR